MHNRIGLDPVFPSPENVIPSGKKIPLCIPLQENKYHLVFDECVDATQLKNYVGQYNKLNPPIVEQDEEEGGSETEGEDQKDD